MQPQRLQDDQLGDFGPASHPFQRPEYVSCATADVMQRSHATAFGYMNHQQRFQQPNATVKLLRHCSSPGHGVQPLQDDSR